MPMFLLSMLGVGKSAMGAVFAWLSRRSLAEIACIALGLVCIVCVLRANHWKHVATERQAALANCEKRSQTLKNDLDRISSVKNDQKVQTQTRIVSVTKTIHEADKQAQKVENAPPAPNCKTNKEVMGADL